MTIFSAFCVIFGLIFGLSMPTHSDFGWRYGIIGVLAIIGGVLAIWKPGY